MTGATSISLSKFTASVQEAVKAAQQRHPSFNLPPVKGITFSWIIRGIPVPFELAGKLTMAETQAFADDVATHLGEAHPELVAGAVGGKGQGMVVSAGGHIICGIPALSDILTLER
jgi:hypothetical protein